MVTITFTKQERKALRKGSTLLFVSIPPTWDTGYMGRVRVPTYRNRVVIFPFLLNFLHERAHAPKNLVIASHTSHNYL